MIASKVNKLSTYKKEIRENENYISILKKVQIVSALLFAGALFLILAEGATSLLIGLDVSILSTIVSYGLSLRSIICIGGIFLGIFSTALVVSGCLFVFGVLKSNSLKRQNIEKKKNKEKIEEEILKFKSKRKNKIQKETEKIKRQNKNSKEKIKEEILKFKSKRKNKIQKETEKIKRKEDEILKNKIDVKKIKEDSFSLFNEIFQNSLQKVSEYKIKLKKNKFEKNLMKFLQSNSLKKEKEDFIIKLIEVTNSSQTEEREKVSKWFLKFLKNFLDKDSMLDKDGIYQTLCKEILKWKLFSGDKDLISYLSIYEKIQDKKIKTAIAKELFDVYEVKVKNLVNIVGFNIKFLKKQILTDLFLEKEFNEKVKKDNFKEIEKFKKTIVLERISELFQDWEKMLSKISGDDEKRQGVFYLSTTMANYLYADDLRTSKSKPEQFIEKAKALFNKLFKKIENKNQALRALAYQKKREFFNSNENYENYFTEIVKKLEKKKAS